VTDQLDDANENNDSAF